ncbi:MAG: ParB/RepB/Spo0J family partition protein [Alphaproteobacteria bacterium]
MSEKERNPKPTQRGLGRGLAALFGEEEEDYAELDRMRQTKTVPVEFLRPNPFQPRRNFDEEQINALVDSVRQQGILQPILVRRHGDEANAYEIVAGERRWRAAQLAKLHEVPVIIKDITDKDSLEIALVENIQRQDLNALEEAEGYRRLMDQFEHTQENLGRAVGKSRSHIANTVRLLNLPDAVKRLVEENVLTAGHGRALLNADDPEALARQVATKGLNVRQTEKLVQRAKAKATGAEATTTLAKDTDTMALERDLSNLLGLKVTIGFRGNGGELTIHYRTLEQLDDVLRRLNAEGAELPRMAGPGSEATAAEGGEKA